MNPIAKGTIFNNAQSTNEVEAGDRSAGVLAAIAAAHEAFACCFAQVPANLPEASTPRHVMLVFTLGPDGTTTSVNVDASRSRSRETALHRCLESKALAIEFPASPTKRTTIVEYPLSLRR